MIDLWIGVIIGFVFGCCICRVKYGFVRTDFERRIRRMQDEHEYSINELVRLHSDAISEKAAQLQRKSGELIELRLELATKTASINHFQSQNHSLNEIASHHEKTIAQNDQIKAESETLIRDLHSKVRELHDLSERLKTELDNAIGFNNAATERQFRESNRDQDRIRELENNLMRISRIAIEDEEEGDYE